MKEVIVDQVPGEYEMCLNIYSGFMVIANV